jgi:DNA polymerase-4
VARSILCVDLDAFFVSVEQARNPELRGKAVVVGGDPDGRGVVATASYEARALGIESGMALRTARRLAPAGVVFLRGDFSKYEEVSRQFHSILSDFTPLVESGGLDEAYLDVTGCEGIAGTGLEAAQRIRARVRAELNLAVSAGIGTSKVVAKVASNKAKPDGVQEVLPGDEADFLAPFPLGDLPGLGPALELRLKKLGIKTIGQLARLSDGALAGLIGRFGPAIGQRCRGIDPTPVAAPDHQKSMSREGTFTNDVPDPEHLRAVLRGFSESVGAELRRDGRRARTVTLKLRYDDFTTISRSVTLPALNSDAAIFDAAASLFARVRSVEQRPVRLIGVGVRNLVADEVQLSFESARQQRFETLSATFDRLRRKYSRRIIQTGRTAFDRASAEGDAVFEKGTGPSSQMK